MNACPSCGGAFDGRYCPRCGERRLEAEDWSIGRFARDAVATLTQADSRAMASFAALVRRPGHLAAEYFAGRRRPYLRPLQIFVICNILYFLIQPLFGWNTLSSSLYVHMHMMPYSTLVRPAVEATVAARGIALTEYQLLFDATVHAQARTLVILLVPLFALLLVVAQAGRRRYMVEHLVFSLHFIAVFMLLLLVTFALLWLALLVPGVTEFLADEGWVDAVVTTGLGIAVAVYLHIGMRRFYGHGFGGAAVRAVMVTAVFFLVVIQLYRGILFLATYYAI